MIIEVKPGVFWDTEARQQSKEAQTWFNDEILPMFCNVPYVFDKYGRPARQDVETGGLRISIVRKYANEKTWDFLCNYIEIAQL